MRYLNTSINYSTIQIKTKKITTWIDADKSYESITFKQNFKWCQKKISLYRNMQCGGERERETWCLLSAAVQSAEDSSSLPPNEEHLPQLSLFELVYEQHSSFWSLGWSCKTITAIFQNTNLSNRKGSLPSHKVIFPLHDQSLRQLVK